MRKLIYVVLMMVVMVGCKPHTTSPRPSPRGEGVACRTLVGIDSLMWQQPDSALKVMLEFAGSEEVDSLNEFEGHYCQVLVAELLFKNDYAQSNRTDVLKAVGYFDSIVDLHGADARGASLRPVPCRDASNASDKTIAFLDARAHYIKGVGYYERDSLVEACTEYLNTLRIMGSRFSENELVGQEGAVYGVDV